MNQNLTIAAHTLGLIAFITEREQRAVTSSEIAERVGTHAVVVRRVLANLSRAGLITSRRGPGGGSMLAKRPAQITLRDVWEAVSVEEGDIMPRRCAAAPCCEIAPLMSVYLGQVYEEAEEALLERLALVTLEAMHASLLEHVDSALP